MQIAHAICVVFQPIYQRCRSGGGAATMEWPSGGAGGGADDVMRWQHARAIGWQISVGGGGKVG
jgi:hypothetical protein